MKNKSKLLFYIGAIGIVLNFLISGYMLLYYLENYAVIENKVIQVISPALVWFSWIPMLYLFLIYATFCASKHMKKELVKSRIALVLQLLSFVLIMLQDYMYDKVNKWIIFGIATVFFVVSMVLHCQIGKAVIEKGLSYMEETEKFSTVYLEQDKLPTKKWSKWLNWTAVAIAMLAANKGEPVLAQVCVVVIGVIIEIFLSHKYIKTYRSMADAGKCRISEITFYLNIILSNAVGLVLCIYWLRNFCTFLAFVSALYMKFRADEKYKEIIEERLEL